MCCMKPKSPIDLHSVGNQDDDHYSPEQAARMLSVPDCVVANLVKSGILERAFPAGDPCNHVTGESIRRALAHGVLQTTFFKGKGVIQ